MHGVVDRMSAETFHLRSASQVGSFVLFLRRLTFDRPWRVTIERVDEHGSDGQRRMIRATVGDMAMHTGEDAKLLYEQLLARRFGLIEKPVGDGRMFSEPAKRVSDMSWKERSDYIDWLHSLCAEYGVPVRR